MRDVLNSSGWGTLPQAIHLSKAERTAARWTRENFQMRADEPGTAFTQNAPCRAPWKFSPVKRVQTKARKIRIICIQYISVDEKNNNKPKTYTDFLDRQNYFMCFDFYSSQLHSNSTFATPTKHCLAAWRGAWWHQHDVKTMAANSAALDVRNPS
jgi:hypothetical protein